MGNTQSQEGDPVEPGTEADSDDQDFDLSKIPDDRESAERDAILQAETDLQPVANPAGSFDKTPDMARRVDLPALSSQDQKQGGSKKGGKKNKKRNRKTTSNHMGDDATASEALTRKADQTSPDALEDSRPLKETEPETYHIYATSDQSDVEEGHMRTKTPSRSGFTAVNGSSRKSPTQVRPVAANEAENEEEDVSPAQGQSPEPDATVEALDVLASAAVSQSSVPVLNPQSSTKIPEPKVNDQGRFLCPFAELYQCTTTLVDKKGAIKHAKVHLKNPGPAIEPATATATASQETASVKTTEIPRPKVNSDGRFPCPFAEAKECGKTFGDRKGALRHAKIHTDEFVCFVCKKKLSRQDKLLKHIKQHSGTEIAVATNANGEATLEQIEDVSEPDAKPGEAVAEAEDEEPVEPEEGDSTEFATPQGMSPLHDEKQQGSVEKMLRGAQDVADSEMVDAEAVEEATDNASEARSITPPSVFDVEETIVKETPMPTAKLTKRKRADEDNAEAGQLSPKRTSKRKKVSPSSPPTSAPSNDVARPETPKSSNVTAAARRGQLTDKIIPRLQTRQGSMDGWAQKFTAGSGLKHPTFNPTPPRPPKQNIQVVIPRTSQAGPSGTQLKRQRRAALDGAVDTDPADAQADSQQEPTRKKSRKAIYATPKGKKRAEPGVEYSTPAKDAVINGDDTSEADTSEADEMSPVNIATSVAKRTFPRQESEEGLAHEDDQDSDFDVTRAPESEDEAGPAARSAKSARPTKRTHNSNKSKKSELDDPANRVECIRCHRMFASEDHLRKHQKKPSAHVGLFKCQRCSEEFYATAALARHEKDTGHGKGTGSQGRIGAFSQQEVNRLNKWRDQFCEYHSISQYEFNEMMTDTLERGQAANWRWAFVKRAEFLKEYVNVLPNRNKRSMLRYRERNFQNLEGMKNWTAEDDSELVRLQKELGSKWSEIARRLGRTVDAVSQRWRHKLQYGDVETGEWSRAEGIKFRNILNGLRGEEGGDDVQDHQIPWNKVSEQMGTRSAQQCSNHYRAMHSKKHRGQWVKIDALEKKDGSSRILTPSKMELRLSGQKGRRTSKKGLSEEFIRDDDDDGDDEEEAAENEDEEAEAEEAEAEEAEDAEGAESAVEQPESDAENNNEDELGVSSEHEDTSTQPTRSRNPLPTKTPGRTLRSSQLFEQTQANTSALKPSQSSSKRKAQPSQDRPSPNIPIQRRRGGLRSPLEELHVSLNGDLETGDESEENTERQESSQELGTSAAATEEQEESDAEGDEVDQKSSPKDSADEDESPTTDSRDEKSADAKVDTSDVEVAVKTESDEEEELVDAEAEEVKEEEDDEEEESADAKAVVESTDDEETQSADENEAVPESPSTSPSPSESESESDSDSDDSDAPAPEEQPTSSFMASINESAKRANIKKVRSDQTQTQTRSQRHTQNQALKGRPNPTGQRSRK